MVSVDYNKTFGHYTLKQGDNEFLIHFCKGNVLCAEIYFYKDDDGEDMMRLYSFFADIQHLKKCAKAGILDHYGEGITLYSEQMDTNLWKMARIFAEQGIKVTIL